MNSDDRIDEALRSIARAEASREFAAQVRVRIEGGDAVRGAWWPRIATTCAAVLLAAAVAWLAREAPRESSEPGAKSAAAVVAARSRAPASHLEPRTRRQDVSRNTGVVSVARSAARVRTATLVPSDHERALEPLSPLDAISLPLVAPDAMVVVDHVIAPLAPIAPLSIVFETVEDVDRGEL